MLCCEAKKEIKNVPIEQGEFLPLSHHGACLLTRLSTFECKTPGFSGVLLKGLHYTRVFMSRMGSQISWAVVGREELILNDLKAKPLLLSIRHSEGRSRLFHR